MKKTIFILTLIVSSFMIITINVKAGVVDGARYGMTIYDRDTGEKNTYDTAYDDAIEYKGKTFEVGDVTKNHLFIINNDVSSTLKNSVYVGVTLYSRIEYYDNNYIKIDEDNIIMDRLTMTNFPAGTHAYRFIIYGLGITYGLDLSNMTALENSWKWNIDDFAQFDFEEGVDSVDTNNVYLDGYQFGQENTYAHIWNEGFGWLEGYETFDNESSYPYSLGYNDNNPDLTAIPNALNTGLQGILDLDFGGISIGGLVLITISFGVFMWFRKINR